MPALRLALVRRMVLEEVAFRIKHLLVRFGFVDVTLVTVHHGNITQAWMNGAARKDIDDISTGIPKILGLASSAELQKRDQYSH